VADRLVQPPVIKRGTIRVTFDGHVTSALLHPVLWDREADWILLECKDPPSAPYIPLSDYQTDSADWRSFGYPDGAVRNGMFQSGVIESDDAPLDGKSVLQLRSWQGLAGPKVKGWSGAPVMVAGVAIGHLRSAAMDQDGRNEAGTLWACKAADVYSRGKSIVAYKASPFDGRIADDRVLPELLLFLANRRLQVTELTEIVVGARGKRRPLVCVAHGEADQSLDMFVRQLAEVELPKILDANVERAWVDSKPVRWPSFPRQVRSGQDWLSIALQQELGDALLKKRTATKQAIADKIAQFPQPTVLHLHVSSADRAWCAPDALQAFVRFWADWPDLQVGQFLLVLLCVTYPHPTGIAAAFGASGGARRVRKRLERAAFGNEPVTFAVLSELESITQGEVESWAREGQTHECCPYPRLLQEIDMLYRRWSSENGTNVIPMDPLARELGRAIERVAALETQ
jgi:hypothetical protein